MMLQSEILFNQVVEKGSFQSLYYLGEMAENGDLRNGIDTQYAYECYLIAASWDNPKAFFKLSIFHKEGKGGCEKNVDLHFLYMKKAAELGLVEAQHNLGQYNPLKALAWFTQAASAEFIHSMYNAAQLYLEGSEDGQIKINLKAGLVWLENIKKTGKMDVNNLIENVLEELEKLEEEKQNQKQY
ncbi:nol1 nop2 sun family protein, putative [Ichthyophthirius multifiliis]|uniref:Nol1 nop2 sun family protein, putative n=1 Tax=Ichthyophthirius multifiliis TaxID=5932 RepID=G0R271_ICHMU|nr:nol1 nop2 sun family protein, putative [Ichthyophthirius multifiliis]EGR28438.1 nol1 nop2 sun family protein, putative [Ichthyophthirius multifiliis]|eukprot:XP_004029674.1 nol1 nop2 sun family protein, putative [Ichthyophthirius multifiliis]